MKFQVTFNDEETALVQQYMKDTGLTISQVALQAILEKIFPSDDDDFAAYKLALAAYKENPTEENLAELKKHFWKGEPKDDF